MGFVFWIVLLWAPPSTYVRDQSLREAVANLQLPVPCLWTALLPLGECPADLGSNETWHGSGQTERLPAQGLIPCQRLLTRS